MTLPNGPAGLVPNIEFGVGFGDLAGLVNRHQDVVADILKAEVQLSVGWNTATAILWEGLQRGIPFVLALLQGIVQRLTNTIEQFPGVAQALDAIEHVPGVRQLQGLIGVAADQFDGTAQALEEVIFNGDGTATATFNAFVTGPVWAIINNLDGTASGLLQLVFNGDGTAGFSSGAAQTVNPLYTLVDNLDGTAMSAADALQNMASPVVGTANYALHNWTRLLTNTGLANAGQLSSSLFGLIPAALDQFDGTAIATGAAQIVENLDGTATFFEQAGANAVATLVDQADGTAMSLATMFHNAATAPIVYGRSLTNALDAGRAVADGVNNALANTPGAVGAAVTEVESAFAGFLGGLHAGFTGGNIAAPPPASAADISAAAAALQQQLVNIGNGGEEQVDVLFNAYTNGALPAAWTFSGGAGQFTIASGQLTYSGSGSIIYYNAASFLTDYQQISATINSLAVVTVIVGRYNPTSQNGVWLEWAGGTLYLITGVDASGPVLCTFTDTFTAGATYTLVCGDPVTKSPLKFQALKNGAPLTVATVSSGSGAGTTTYTDAGASNYGGAYRNAGVYCGSTGTATFSEFKFLDTTPSSPSVFVSTSEATSSATYANLATTSDEVVVAVGASGKVIVFLDAYSSSANGFVSVDVSGGSTVAASDTNAAAGINSISATIPLDGLTPGTTAVFKMKYRSSSGSVSFSNRRISVLALT